MYGITSQSSNPDFYIYLGYLLNIVSPVLLIILFSFYNYCHKHKNKNRDMRIHYTYAMIFSIFLFFAPVIFKKALKFLNCRKIADKEYLAANLLFECGTSLFYTMQWVLIIPSIFIIVAIIPGIICWNIAKNGQKKEEIIKYQYLLADYKSSCKYWELLKFIEKIVIFALATFLNNDSKSKALLISLIIVSYCSFSYYKQPYKTKKLNLFDNLTSISCFLSY